LCSLCFIVVNKGDNADYPVFIGYCIFGNTNHSRIFEVASRHFIVETYDHYDTDRKRFLFSEIENTDQLL